MALPQFTETTAKRLAYGFSLLWLLTLGAALFENAFFSVAAMFGFAGGIWMGRLSEARENAKGNGLILGK